MPMPMRIFEVSIFNGSSMVLPKPIPTPFTMLSAVIFFVVPLAASVVSLTSTTGIMSVAAGAADSSVNAVIFLVLISLLLYACHEYFHVA